MMQKYMRCALAVCVIATAFLTGCATAPAPSGAGQSTEAFNKSLAEADALAAKSEGDSEGSIRRYQKIAADNPSRGEPWARIGQIHFAQGNYSLAIVAAEETLKRDPSNRQAKSINAVGGLRLAARSLDELRKDSSLTGDTTADAQRLATLLRETLGQSALLPAPAVVPRPVPVRRAAPRRGKVVDIEGDTPARQAPPAAAPVVKPKASGGNPLDAFK